jgi:hypothetical protein
MQFEDLGRSGGCWDYLELPVLRPESNPHFPPSGPTQWLFQEPPAESKFVATGVCIPRFDFFVIIDRSSKRFNTAVH